MALKLIDMKTRLFELADGNVLVPTRKYIAAGSSVNFGKQRTCKHNGKSVIAIEIETGEGSYFILSGDLDPVSREYREDNHNEALATE